MKLRIWAVATGMVALTGCTATTVSNAIVTRAYDFIELVNADTDRPMAVVVRGAALGVTGPALAALVAARIPTSALGLPQPMVAAEPGAPPALHRVVWDFGPGAPGREGL